MGRPLKRNISHCVTNYVLTHSMDAVVWCRHRKFPYSQCFPSDLFYIRDITDRRAVECRSAVCVCFSLIVYTICILKEERTCSESVWVFFLKSSKVSYLVAKSTQPPLKQKSQPFANGLCRRTVVSSFASEYWHCWVILAALPLVMCVLIQKNPDISTLGSWDLAIRLDKNVAQHREITRTTLAEVSS